MFQWLKTGAMVAGVIAAIAATPDNSSAGLFGWGCCGGYGYGGYGYGGYSSYYPPMGWSSYYGPGGYYGSALAYGGSCGCNSCGCNPCGCSPCGAGGCGVGGCASGNCASGNCGVPAQPQGNPPAPLPDPNLSTPPANPPRRTYETPPANGDTAPNFETPMNRGSSGSTPPRTRSNTNDLPDDSFRPSNTRPNRNNSNPVNEPPPAASGAGGANAADFGADPGSFDTPGNTSRRINVPEEQVIPARKPAEAVPVNDDAGPNLEGRTTTRPVVTKSRLSVRALENVRVVRNVRPGIDWSALDAHLARQ